MTDCCDSPLKMAEDMDMDAPQISTLRDETSPEPNPIPKVRLKLSVDKGQSSKAGSTSSKHARADSEEDDDEDDEDEEDQLIDDDDDDVPVKPAPAVPPPVPVPTRGSPAKRGSRGRGGGRRGRGGRGAASMPGPGVGVFETVPTESTSAQEPRAEVWDPMAADRAYVQPIPGQPPRKKPGPPKGTPAQRTIRKKPSKYAIASYSPAPPTDAFIGFPRVQQPYPRRMLKTSVKVRVASSTTATPALT